MRLKYKASKYQYPHERKALVVTLRNIIVNIMDRFGIEFDMDSGIFYKMGTNQKTKLASIQEIMKGL